MYLNGRRITSKAQERFINNEGQRWYRGHEGIVRCHAKRRSYKKILLEKYGPDVDFDDHFAEIQCGLPARPGYYVCHWHGMGKKNGPPGGRPPLDMGDYKGLGKFMRKDLADKFAEFESDPELFNQRASVAVLTARIAELLETLQKGALPGKKALDVIHDGLALVESGEIQRGVELIRKGLSQSASEKAAWSEIQSYMGTIKDLSNAEINRQKEMRLSLTQDQVFSLLDRMLNLIVDTISTQVEDKDLAVKLLQIIRGGVNGIIGSGPQSLLIEAGRGDREADGDAIVLDQ